MMPMARDDQPTVLGNTDAELDASFRQFYDEVEQVLRMRAPVDSPSAAETLAQQAMKHLVSFIELQELQLRRQAGRSAAALAEPVRYLKAALADEILLQRDWSGRDCWSRYLLEAALFRSSVAGDKVFTDIERLLSEREPGQRPLARLQLFTLALGFQGRWRGQADLSQLQGLRAELYQFVYQRRPNSGELNRPLMPQAYTHTLSHLAPQRRRTVSRGTLAWLLALFALLAVSELVWLWTTWPLRQHATVITTEASL